MRSSLKMSWNVLQWVPFSTIKIFDGLSRSQQFSQQYFAYEFFNSNVLTTCYINLRFELSHSRIGEEPTNQWTLRVPSCRRLRLLLVEVEDTLNIYSIIRIFIDLWVLRLSENVIVQNEGSCNKLSIHLNWRTNIPRIKLWKNFRWVNTCWLNCWPRECRRENTHCKTFHDILSENLIHELSLIHIWRCRR